MMESLAAPSAEAMTPSIIYMLYKVKARNRRRRARSVFPPHLPRAPLDGINIARAKKRIIFFSLRCRRAIVYLYNPRRASFFANFSAALSLRTEIRVILTVEFQADDEQICCELFRMDEVKFEA